jgi:uncharacterized FAD-dependent dehydrogenase
VIRITELRLPLDHPEDELRAAIQRRLGVDDGQLLALSIFRRAVDARRRSRPLLTYTVDVEVADESAVLRARAGDAQV